VKKELFFIVLIVITISSCVPQRYQKYGQDNAQKEFQSLEARAENPRKVTPYDELFIQVMSFDEKTSNFFNGTKGSNSLNTDVGISLYSYVVNDSGCIEFPFIGKILLRDLTLTEVREKLKKVLNDYLEQPEIIVRFINNKITLLGEVNRPGTYVISKDKISILHALGLGGDISYFGNRQKVTIMRKQNQKTTYNYIDLTSKDMVNSDYFYLLPDDIVYVEPLPNKVWGLSTFPYATILSTVSTVLLMMNYFK
jgi:polysaccharide biosynthesis/export protein